MGEPVLDMSEIMELYKEDARVMVVRMQAALKNWPEVQAAGTARQDLRRISHQLRGSGRTYGFRNVTRISKAIEKIMIRMEAQKLSADDVVRASLQKKVQMLESAFKA